MSKQPSEKIGSFYLGAEYDNTSGSVTDLIVDYDARDLTTHAVCVGMTGSGKTGLCIGLLEEAALDRVPALIIDPKGDMTNLLLQFEDLSPEDFKPWVNIDDANRKGMTVDEYATKISNQWSEGIASWGQNKDRIKALKKSVDYTIYTPGSTAGIPINILGSFSAPRVDFDSDAEMIRERIQGIVAALLGMIGSKEDPVRSREGILLSNLFEHYWRQGTDLDLTLLIKGIQSPPMSQLGVFDIETFYPSKDRFDLAMSFNTLIASPQFKNWLEGDDLDIDKLYFTADGKPRHSIFYIAHLSDSERMFFVTLLLNALISWMRSQSGTTSLRSLLYFDEIFGYFPPTANPPSKKPLLTLLKQARAFGVGTVLVTQNPVDIDYKGLSNAGTWFIGKLQTERDKMRILEALEGAISESGSKSQLDYDKLISGLDSRVFLMHNVHEDGPVLFHTRWVLSYLRGPMTRPQIESLMSPKKQNVTDKDNNQTSVKTARTTRDHSVSGLSALAPSLDPEIHQKYLIPENSDLTDQLTFYPKILAVGRVRFLDTKRDCDKIENISLLLDPPDEFGRLNWEEGLPLEDWESKLRDNVKASNGIELRFAEIPDSMNTRKELNNLENEFSDYLYHNKLLKILEHEDLELYQRQNESEEAFMMRVAVAAREERDEEIEELREAYAKKLEKLEDKIRDEERDLYDAEEDAKSRKQDEFINIAETVFSVLGKGRRRSFSTVSTKRRMSRRATERVDQIRDEIEDLQLDYKDLEKELSEKISEIQDHWRTAEDNISEKAVKPRRADVFIENMIVCWTAE